MARVTAHIVHTLARPQVALSHLRRPRRILSAPASGRCCVATAEMVPAWTEPVGARPLSPNAHFRCSLGIGGQPHPHDQPGLHSQVPPGIGALLGAPSWDDILARDGPAVVDHRVVWPPTKAQAAHVGRCARGSQVADQMVLQQYRHMTEAC